MTDQPTPLHEQVRTLEADLVMCREQLAQETERAERAEKSAYSRDEYTRFLDLINILGGRRLLPDGTGNVESIADLARRVVRERDKWRDRALRSADYEQQHGAQLPTPDATNPAHWRFSADVIASANGFSRFRSDDTLVVVHLRREADRLEAAQQQADADKELIEKAARTLAFAAERNDDGVTESEMWETYLIRESRRKYLDHARALHRASLLQGGDEK